MFISATHSYGGLLVFCPHPDFESFNPAFLTDEENLPENWKTWVRTGHNMTLEERTTPIVFGLAVDESNTFMYCPFVLVEKGNPKIML